MFRLSRLPYVFTMAVALAGCDRSASELGQTSSPTRAGDNPGSIENVASSDDPPPNRVVADQNASTSSIDRVERLELARQLAQQGKFGSAAKELRDVLLVDPEDVEATFLLAKVTAAAGDLSRAVLLLDSIPSDHPEAGLASLGQAADWCMELKRYEDAELRYSKILEAFPGAAPAHRQLAYLFNRQGRRHEAAHHIRELCKMGNVRQDELHSLIVLNHAMYDDPSMPLGPDEIAYHPIGAGAVARMHFTNGEFESAADAIEELVADGRAHPAITALYGRIVTESQDDERFLWWLARTDEKTKQFADYWAALGTYLISQRRFDEATRALLEAVDRDPSDTNSVGRLVQTTSTLGDDAASERWTRRWAALNECIKANNRVAATKSPDPDDVAELATRLDEANRPLEAVLWRSLEGHYRGTLQQAASKWNQKRIELVQSGTCFESEEQRLCRLDLGDFPLPDLSGMESKIASNRPRPPDRADRTEPSATPRFVNIAADIGLEHNYQIAPQPQAYGFAIYQTLGGGAVAFDYDLNGQCDLFFAQGGGEPPDFVGPYSNQLYRHCDGDLVDVTVSAGAVNRHYSLGATSGDWNQDGFPDLLVSDLGQSKLMINNGDGTFTTRPLDAPALWSRLPSSSAIADVTGDGIPEIIELTYVDDPMMISLPKRNENGEVLGAMSPFQFAPGADRLYINDGSGREQLSPHLLPSGGPRLGLGLIVTDFNDDPGIEIFVGNDVYPDSLWVRQSSTDAWADIAPLVGCAYGVRGSKTASMGIAADDLDGNGMIDLHITNFQDRNSSLLLNLGESFLERNVQFGMARASQAVLGWGTQAIDYDNDSRRDLVVTNGHIEKAVTIDAPFEQSAQVFTNLGNRFALTDVEDESGYWSSKHLGRGLARLDFDRDGKNDFVVTHLGENSALLINRTETDNHWLQLTFVGVHGERDAIGAKVQIDYAAGQQATGWVTAGDGYFSKNESVVSFGLGAAAEVDRVSVTWPQGTTQTFESVTANQRWLIIEGQPLPYPLP